ncbi:MAG: hypothetical protein B7Y37_11615 [Sphingobacteriia bacterium 28-36-52]|nr:MAG: hypothetical protein B7Z27_02450 [Sphingobacteriia bacterium 32-37-4]OYZ00144.1 MAG: hypothetical protein B7Y37_11615 [Sphingobacteriia bacterium 28-36-52]
MKNNSIIKERQQPLMNLYNENPIAAWVTDMAIIEGKQLDDPLHTSVSINEELLVDFPIGVHRAVGGHHDYPNSGDLLCAALASCFDTALRMIANRLQIPILNSKIIATAEVDVRGTLMVNKEVPVGFQKMSLFIEITVQNSVPNTMAEKLIQATERSCIVYQTILRGTPIDVKTTIHYV